MGHKTIIPVRVIINYLMSRWIWFCLQVTSRSMIEGSAALSVL